MSNTSIKKAAPGQQGFTLIEIIAVLVILGILAAVATPKFLNLQDEAREKALEGAVAAAQSQVAMSYARQILVNDGNEETAWTNLNSTVCAQVSTDGFGDDFEWTICDKDGDTFNIVAFDGTNSANGTFTRPTAN